MRSATLLRELWPRRMQRFRVFINPELTPVSEDDIILYLKSEPGLFP